MSAYVFHFGGGATNADPRARDKTITGGKGANLAEMAGIGLPVPPGFTISTEVCTAYNAAGKTLRSRPVAPAVAAALAHVERPPARTFGDPANPLLVSVRSGARVSMPGMMDTVLNLGLNDVTVEGLARRFGRRALRLGQLSPLHPDVFRCGAGHRSPPLRGRRWKSPRKTTASRSIPRSAEHWQAHRRAVSRPCRRGRARPARSRRMRTSSFGARSAQCSARG